MQSTEKWLPVVGYEGLYEVSDRGRVRSLDRIDPLGRPRSGRVLIPTGLKHVHVTLSVAGKKTQQAVHRLVLEAFAGPCPEWHEALHGDDDPKNNHLSNLRWGTRAENRADAVRNGRHVGGGLGEESVLSIREMCSSGLSQREISKMFNIDQSTVSLIVNRKVWKHV